MCLEAMDEHAYAKVTLAEALPGPKEPGGQFWRTLVVGSPCESVLPHTVSEADSTDSHASWRKQAHRGLTSREITGREYKSSVLRVTCSPACTWADRPPGTVTYGSPPSMLELKGPEF